MYLPEELIVGFTKSLTIPITKYDPNAGWTLHVSLRGPAEYVFDGTAGGKEWSILLAPTKDGLYQATIYAQRGLERELIDNGRIRVQPDPTTIELHADLRTHAERVLEAIEAVIEKRATKDQSQITINGTQLVKTSWSDLQEIKKYYTAVVAQEQGKAPTEVVFTFGGV